DDRREVQASLDAELLRAPDRRGDTWVDYVADIGDGFDATFTVAWLLGRESLDVGGHELRRGSVLVLGGDEVYPTPSAMAYDNRMRGPYRCALPRADEPPLLAAIPGNHDWYDGLTNFLRVFGQKARIGGWQTQQSRSYFAVQLPHRWWLLGIDTQLGTYIDGPQLAYFEEHVTSNLRPGDGVIVCSATPTWVHTGVDDVDAFNSLHWFDRIFVRTRRLPDGEREETGAAVRLWISGDSHHYVRFAEELPDDETNGVPPDPRRRQLVTCGLGGAYQAATHTVPDRLELPPRSARLHKKDTPPVTYRRGPASVPDEVTSVRRISRLAAPWSRYWLPRRNPGFAQLAAGLQVALYLLASFVFGLTQGMPPTEAVRHADLGAVSRFDVEALVAVALAAFAPWVLRLVRRRELRTPSTTIVAVLLQAAVALLMLTAAVAVPWPQAWPDWLVLALGVTGTAVAGAVLGSEAFALYVLTARSGRRVEVQAAGLAYEDAKGVVSVRIAVAGDPTPEIR